MMFLSSALIIIAGVVCSTILILFDKPWYTWAIILAASLAHEFSTKTTQRKE